MNMHHRLKIKLTYVLIIMIKGMYKLYYNKFKRIIKNNKTRKKMHLFVKYIH